MNKKYIFGIIFLIVAVIIAGGVWYFKSAEPSGLQTYYDPKLTQEETAKFESNISDLQKQLNELSSDAPKEDRYRIYLQLGIQYSTIGKLKEAQKSFLDATKVLPENATAWGELYVVENRIRDFESAKEHIEKAISLNNSNAQFWQWKLELFKGPLATGQEQMKQLFAEALQNTKDNAAIIIFYAQFLEEKGDLVGAVQEWRDAIAKNPGSKAQYEAEIARIQAKLQ